MKKSTAIRMFGNGKKLAMAMSVSKQAVSNWPEVLDTRRSDEVVGAALRLGIPIHEIGMAMAEPAVPYSHERWRCGRKKNTQMQSMVC